MFYSRREKQPSLLRYLIMFCAAAGLALFFLVTDPTYNRAGVMGTAALLCGGYLLWQMRRFESAEAVKDEVTQPLRDLWR